MERKLVLYIAMSLDGYIAAENDDLSFLSAVEQEGEDYGYAEFINTIDTIILGRKTYDKVISMGHPYPMHGEKVYVITRSEKPSIGSVEFYSGDLNELVGLLKQQPGKNIFCDGGAEIVNLLLKAGLFDEITISIIPVLLGSGVRLFQDGGVEQKLKLVSSKSFPKGLVQLHYTN
jgi:dihydrofolate reductase